MKEYCEEKGDFMRKKKYALVHEYHRKGYHRRGYTRKDGVKVSPAYVPPTTIRTHRMRVWHLAKNQKPVNPRNGRESRRRR